MEVMTAITNTASRSLQGTVYHSDYCQYTNTDGQTIRSWYNGLTTTTAISVSSNTTFTVETAGEFEGAKSYFNVTAGFYGTSSCKFGTGGGQQGRDIDKLTNYLSVANDNEESYLFVQRRIMDRHYREPVQDISAYVIRPFHRESIGNASVKTVSSVYRTNGQDVETTVTTAIINHTDTFSSFSGSDIWRISNYVVPIVNWDSTKWGISTYSSPNDKALYSVEARVHVEGSYDANDRFVGTATVTDSKFYVPYGITFDTELTSSNTMRGYSSYSRKWESTQWVWKEESTERQTNIYDQKNKFKWRESTALQKGYGVVLKEQQYGYTMSSTTSLAEKIEIIGE